MSSRFNVVSLFAGCGGSSLGYQMAGGKCLLAVEWDSKAVETYRLNFPQTKIYHGDIADLSVEECLILMGLKSKKLDILDGSPPCQGFSTAGKRILEDPRNSLFKEYIRLLWGLQPKVFVMENVSGMLKGKMKWVFAEIMKELKASGYQVKCRLMNAKYYGVPQDRKRVIFIGVRNDLRREPSYPNPQTRAITVREAIGHLPIGSKEKHEPQVIEAWYGSQPGVSLRKTNRFVGSFQSVRLDPGKPSPTQIKSHLNWHYAIPRYLTIQETALLQGFPMGFSWIGAVGKNKEQIGNSVPPPLMKAIAEHIRDNLLGTQ